MKIVIIDTYSGLCNQFYDITCGVNFCITNNIKFSFRYCSFRNPNLVSWKNSDFNKLFDTSLFKKYEDLYVDFENIHLTNENTYNFNGALATRLFTSDYLNEIISIPNDYVVLKQFWSVYKFSKIIDNVFSRIRPSKRLMELYDNIKNQLLQTNEQYNCIHYRYEVDFTSYFKVTIENLKDIILRLKPQFKQPNLRIYIATSDITKVIDLNDIEISEIIFTKNVDELKDYNFEELAFIDYMFGLNANEIVGHNKSSFSHMLNDVKGTNKYYN